MNDNNSPKNYASLSQELNSIFDHMDCINTSFKRVEAYIEQKYKDIEHEINPKNNQDVSRELQYHMASFLKNLANDFENKNRLLD